MAEKDISGMERESLNELCRRVEETTGIVPDTALKFEALAEAVSARTGVLLSPTTLKRIWGYLKEDCTPRQSTLNVLARCCGWQSYEDFLSGNAPEIESGPISKITLRADKDIKTGEKVRLMWAPARVCVIKYLGGARWRVEESEGTRLKPGDTFSCPLIVSGEPLYLDDLKQEGSKASVYVCGRKSGVRFERI